MDTKNIIAAISLSAAVIILYSLFFVEPPDPNKIKKDQVKKTKIVESSDAPALEQNENFSKLSRKEVLNESKRIEFENNNIVGTINTVGALLDDLTFKKYNIELGGNEKIILLNPRKVENGYLIESGFVTNNKNIDTPNSSTIWKIIGNNKLTTKNPIKLVWSNTQGITFEKNISLDDQFLFTVREKVINSSDKTYNFYSYSQIIRNKKPEISGFYILHEGLVATLDEELIEEDYDDIEEEKFSRNASKGWFGIGDKYWITSVIPPRNKSFKTTFDYKNKFRANYISTEGIEAGPNDAIEEEIQIIVAAKRVETIDGYAQKLKIDKFDLVIDWGVLYFLTRPLFFLIDYLFKFCGNYGVAIILMTLCIRVIFFPLANFSFRSMAKMKMLQPEMKRLKELHKEDKMKLQQEMMALYKREKVNPMSGCLPILVQIPVFFALYKVLFVTIEMRHQPFFGWIRDLSDKDPTSVFNLFGLIPWDPPSFLIIGAWPIAMGISMWVQQKLNPAPPDPIQAKIFMFFPIFLTVILAPFPSGLVVYWTINNILTMAQQLVIMKRTTVKTT
ncbi:MAG TPA: membrane protein insertase YidC [Candidatus Pelagibacter bacterium]|jgi:YidC/Oxa1 family membrane protein insertase|nr:membrane protein insertase YidC [Pelagibacteraceae bacterium]HJN83932.1 membrane protein insertase YidC [Candidatus Pelagibacter bacterium]|tara:strand:+ start:1545 stop:3227 length:1683 start_codon:yes stop_codon:yes gene_type:complete